MLKAFSILPALVAAGPFDDLPKVNVSDFTQDWFNVPLDHYNKQSRDQIPLRYWENAKYSDGTGPIFLYICGEYTCSIREDRLFPYMVGADWGASLYALEHRYYGESVPGYKEGGQYDPSQMQYLSSQQALADIASFVLNITNASPDRKVVVVGGSYPGALSAWFRQRYPHLAVASWASSAVVYPVAYFDDFDNQVATSAAKSGDVKEGVACQYALQNWIDSITSAVVTGSTTDDKNPITYMTGLKFGSPEYEALDWGDYFFYVADIVVEGVQYGNRTDLCDIFRNDPDPSYADSGVPAYTVEMKAFADSIGVGLDDYNRNGPNFKNFGSSAYPWTYQYCTEFGFYQVPAREEGQTRMRSSLYLDIGYWEEGLCATIADNIVHADPDVDTALHATVAEYGGSVALSDDPSTIIRYGGSNVIFTNGVEDPWQWATERQGNPEFNQVSLMADCENCAHCADLYTPLDTDSDELNQVRLNVIKFLQDILQPEQEMPTVTFLQ